MASGQKNSGPQVVKCTICKRVDLCIECFALGSESADIHAHSRSHAYHVMDNLGSFSLYERDWTAKDELMLLDGIDMFGFGNWKEISTYIGTKTDVQCQQHYMSVYIDSATAPKPSPLASSSAKASAAAPTASPSLTHTHTHSAAAATTTTGGGRAGGPPTGLGTPGYSHAHIPRVEVSGYMPLRGDFDVEAFNDAEAVLADMEFVEGEHATETELKLKVLEIYNAKLDERERRKAFVLERGLLEYKRLLAVERRRPKEEREVYEQFRPFARFMTPGEFEQLVRGIILENRLRKRIAQLQEYKRLGIRSLAEAAEYEATRRRKDSAAASNVSASFAALRRNAAAEMSAWPAPAAATSARAGRSRSAAPGDAAPTPTEGTATDSGLDVSGRKRRRGDRPEDASTTAPAAAAPASSAAEPFSLGGIPGADRLSPSERQLCEHLRLLPNQYHQIKATILNISFVRGFVKRAEPASMLVHVDVEKINGVYDFCVSAGWATPASSS